MGFLGVTDTNGRLTSANIWIAAIDGADARAITHPPSEFTGSYRDPAWAPDGLSIWTTVAIPEQAAESDVVRIRSEIRRIEIETGRETLVIADGHGPAPGPNGERLVYVTTDPETGRNAIWRNTITGDEPHQLVGPERFETIYTPMRFAPDGRLLAFAAAEYSARRNSQPAAANAIPGDHLQ